MTPDRLLCPLKKSVSKLGVVAGQHFSYPRGFRRYENGSVRFRQPGPASRSEGIAVPARTIIGDLFAMSADSRAKDASSTEFPCGLIESRGETRDPLLDVCGAMGRQPLHLLCVSPAHVWDVEIV